MPKYVDAEKLEKDGWYATRIYHQDVKTMVYETKKMTNLPTADVPDRKVGKWVQDGKGFYECTSCGEAWSHWWAVIVPPDRMYKELRFCPKCGADMRGSKDE